MEKKIRESLIKRKTTETDISGKLVIDGSGKTDIDTGIGFLDHMLTLFTFHGLFDLTLTVKGDLKVDRHHTNEDAAICLGKAFKQALGDCSGIKRYGSKEVWNGGTSNLRYEKAFNRGYQRPCRGLRHNHDISHGYPYSFNQRENGTGILQTRDPI